MLKLDVGASFIPTVPPSFSRLGKWLKSVMGITLATASSGSE
ncbi:uncharacterized protein METZ01_LOCUS89811 [marine metagenome]|uniref:Uncharacterized protein n=1 Tax=marine metagenome TaxID=408172 RepID=A0A381VBA8_9ZZZZ